MADLKISQLGSITVLTPATDVLPVVDSGGVTKKITTNQILGSGGTATLASATISGDLTVDTSTLKVDSANNYVGVGTTTFVSDANVPFQITTSGGTNSKYIGINRNNAYGVIVGWDGSYDGGEMRVVGAYPLKFGTSNTQRYEISSTGIATWSNVGGVAGTAMTLNANGLGIGVTPSANGEKLNANGTIISTNQSIGGFALNQAGFDYSTSTKNLRIFSGTSNATGSSMSFVVGTSTSFLTALTLNSLGDFGVGITSPSYRLHSIVASGADKNIFAAQVSGASNGFEVKWNHATTTLRVIVSNLPTSSAGLASGTLWIDTSAGNTLKVA